MEETNGVGDQNFCSRNENQYRYRAQYKHLKRTMKQLIFENASLVQEIRNTDNQLATAKLERKALLKRLLQFEKPESKSVKSTTQKKAANNQGSKKTVNKEDAADSLASNNTEPAEQTGIVCKMEQMDSV